MISSGWFVRSLRRWRMFSAVTSRSWVATFKVLSSFLSTARTTTIDLVDFRGDDAEHEALLRRPAHKYRPGRRRRHVQVRRCSPLRREPLLRQALLEDSPAWRVADAQEG